MARRDGGHPLGKPVIVRWIDSTSTTGWRAKAGADLRCTTVGLLVESTKDRVAVVQSRSAYGDADLIEIPKVAVKSIRRLKE